MLDVAGGETTETGCIVTPLKVVCICFLGGLWLGRFTWCLSPSKGTCRHVSLPGKSIQQGLHLQRQPIFSNHHHPSERKPDFKSPKPTILTILWLSIKKVNKVQLQITPGNEKKIRPAKGAWNAGPNEPWRKPLTAPGGAMRIVKSEMIRTWQKKVGMWAPDSHAFRICSTRHPGKDWMCLH